MNNRGFFDRIVGIVYCYENAHNKRDLWATTEEFTYYIGPISDNKTIKVPKGFLTDGASVPRMFWNIFPPWGRYGQAAILHDHLCVTRKLTTNGTDGILPITQRDADVIFLHAMASLEVPFWKRKLIYYCVRIYNEASTNW